ncbi:hypothetical protein NDA10_002892 [Ustilago hordei]|nr:hypothetical protein NDA10_002892 [Ustilago hordei]KAJ1577038.1 hypothetical protein NDA15_005641 [Ustilago hordei]KAJ1578567.1 hypothetical protein NDA12_002058 [Ustilago hordei]UTT91294.1 hypothetical protein NDA17_006863 [Ustilago hordei]
MNRSLGEKMRMLLMQRKLPRSFWLYAIQAAAFKINLTPNVDVKRDSKRLDQQAVATIFLGYSLERRGWLFYSPDYNPNIFWSNSVKFMEDKCWSDRTEWCPTRMQSPPVLADKADLSDLGYTNENLFNEREREPHDEHLDMNAINEPNDEKDSIEDMAKYTKNETDSGIQAGDPILGLTAMNHDRQRNLDLTVSEALSGEDKQHWKEAMHKELDGLRAMGTWEITNLPKGMNAINTCWVLKIKMDADLILTKFKARLVAQGFMQRQGIDYTEVFAPVAPIQSIRGVLAIATVQDWEVDCIDVKQAYLNSMLHHDMFLKPLIGTKIPPGKHLKLIKGLYGLKQSGREWNLELDSHL